MAGSWSVCTRMWRRRRFCSCGSARRLRRRTGAAGNSSSARVDAGQNQVVLIRQQTLVEALEIPAAGLDESVELLRLGQPDGGLQVRHLQVVADVGVDVLVIVAVRQFAGLPLEA